MMTTEQNVSPDAEFAETTETEPKTADKVEAGASRREMDELKAALAEQVRTVDGLKADSGTVKRIRDALGDEGKAPLSERDKYVRDEIKRLMPEFEEQQLTLSQLRQVIPAILQTMEATVEERVAEKAESANEHLRGLMTKAGLDGSDDEAAGYLEEAMTKEIRGNKELLALWARGNVKNAVNKAFEKVSSKLLAPARLKAKMGAVSATTEGPKAGPRPGAASASGAAQTGKSDKLDFGDTSRSNTRKIHDAAFDFLTELQTRE